MKIEILGTGCAKCKNLYENTKKALEESGKSAEVVKVIDGEVKFSGKVASASEIMGML